MDNKYLILPVKPVFAERILNGTKKYEFRKKLNKKRVSRIYIYVTSPIKAIAGWFSVVDSLSYAPDVMWSITQNDGGISVDNYQKYFEDKDIAYAYKIGECHRFEYTVKLRKIGIDYVPQQYVYISEQTGSLIDRIGDNNGEHRFLGKE